MQTQTHCQFDVKNHIVEFKFSQSICATMEILWILWMQQIATIHKVPQFFHIGDSHQSFDHKFESCCNWMHVNQIMHMKKTHSLKFHVHLMSCIVNIISTGMTSVSFSNLVVELVWIAVKNTHKHLRL